MKVYKVIYLDECETPREVFEHTELVQAKELINYVNILHDLGRIYDDTYNIFLEKHPQGVLTEQDAIELLEMDGFSVASQKV